MFSTKMVIILVCWSSVMVVLKPGLSLILISDFLTPLSTCISFATFRTKSSACSRFKSSLKLVSNSSIISEPL